MVRPPGSGTMKESPHAARERSTAMDRQNASFIERGHVCVYGWGLVWPESEVNDMDVRRMDALSDWDDWAEDEPEWWLRHPLHRPRIGRHSQVGGRTVGAG